MKNNILFLFIALFVLSGCSTFSAFDPKTNVRLVNTEIFPEFPDITPLQPLNLLPWEADIPRDSSRIVPKNITKCLKVPENKRDRSYWITCGENPILEGSNIYLGMDQTNWNIMVEDFAKLKERLQQYEARIREINNQRKKWRDQAEDLRNKTRQIEENPVK